MKVNITLLSYTYIYAYIYIYCRFTLPNRFRTAQMHFLTARSSSRKLHFLPLQPCTHALRRWKPSIVSSLLIISYYVCSEWGAIVAVLWRACSQWRLGDQGLANGKWRVCRVRSRIPVMKHYVVWKTGDVSSLEPKTHVSWNEPPFRFLHNANAWHQEEEVNTLFVLVWMRCAFGAGTLL